MSSHLDEVALEALAHGRDDLVGAEQRTHLDACGDCVAAVEEARALSRVAGAVLTAATPEAVDLDALVRAVVAAAPVLAPAPRASRRSLSLGVLVAAPAALVLGLASFSEGLGVGGFLHGLRDAWTVGFTLFRLALVHVTPGALATVGTGGAVLVALLSLSIRVLVGGPRAARSAVEVVR